MLHALSTCCGFLRARNVFPCPLLRTTRRRFVEAAVTRYGARHNNNLFPPSRSRSVKVYLCPMCNLNVRGKRCRIPLLSVRLAATFCDYLGWHYTRNFYFQETTTRTFGGEGLDVYSFVLDYTPGYGYLFAVSQLPNTQTLFKHSQSRLIRVL